MSEQQQGSDGGVLGSVAEAVRGNDTSSRLAEEAKNFAQTSGSNLLSGLGSKLSGLTDKLEETAQGGGFQMEGLAQGAKKIAQGESPVKAAASAVGTGVKEKTKSLMPGGGGGDKPKMTNIVEDIDVGVPVSVAYNQWTQFQEWSTFTKGVESVDQQDDVSTSWKAKIFLSGRRWKSTITEQVPDRRISWKSDGDKGTVDGTVTFHPLADDLTRILMVLEYHPKGLFEKTGNLWRAQGRRARLDLKHFRRFVMRNGEATGSWRGEISDSEVVREPGEAEEPQRDGGEQAGASDGQSGEQGQAQQDGQAPESGEQAGGEQQSSSGQDESDTAESEQQDASEREEVGASA